MISDPGILCVQHCSAKIFSFQLPESCPLCTKKILNGSSNFALLPFRLPYPFVRASQTQAAVILRPTNGDFLNDYNNKTDLHIALTTSQGIIVEFDRHGLRRHVTRDGKSLWEQSLVVESVPEAWYEHWDETLAKMCKQGIWTEAAYKKDTHNCYTFVLTFLQALSYGELSRTAKNRTLFCEKFICPRTVVAGKYISLYRKIRDHGSYVHLSTGKSSGSGSAGTRARANMATALKQ